MFPDQADVQLAGAQRVELRAGRQVAGLHPSAGTGLAEVGERRGQQVRRQLQRNADGQNAAAVRGVPDQELEAELPFQRGHRLRQRRLADVQPSCRRRQAAFTYTALRPQLVTGVTL